MNEIRNSIFRVFGAAKVNELPDESYNRKENTFVYSKKFEQSERICNIFDEVEKEISETKTISKVILYCNDPENIEMTDLEYLVNNLSRLLKNESDNKGDFIEIDRIQFEKKKWTGRTWCLWNAPMYRITLSVYRNEREFKLHLTYPK